MTYAQDEDEALAHCEALETGRSAGLIDKAAASRLESGEVTVP